MLLKNSSSIQADYIFFSCDIIPVAQNITHFIFSFKWSDLDQTERKYLNFVVSFICVTPVYLFIFLSAH